MKKEDLYEAIFHQYELDLESLGYTINDAKPLLDALTDEKLEEMSNGEYHWIRKEFEDREEDETALRNRTKESGAYEKMKKAYENAMNIKAYFEAAFWAYDMLYNRMEKLFVLCGEIPIPGGVAIKCGYAEKFFADRTDIAEKFYTIEPAYENEMFDEVFSKITIWCRDMEDFTHDFIYARNGENVNRTARDIARVGGAYAGYLDRCVKALKESER